MSHTPDPEEIRFAYQIRQALDESASQLPAGAAERLAAARRQAIARKKPEARIVREPVLVTAMGAPLGLGAGSRRPGGLLNRFGLLLPLLALILVLAGISYWERQQRINDLADIDAAVMSDELPLSAYLDHGFDVYLKHDAQ
ncbi:MAG: DUF3619 family protein [Burkholderiales bacterium]|nr:DUF3619 family protein [Burkholderiales bacterium]MDE2287343.1 DUF3619 family protein [Burkholderiales bacterium]MDE2610623.1 DUF3619 family protein [Burkholderiales bacterium]